MSYIDYFLYIIKHFTDKLLARLNKGKQKPTTSANNQTPKKQTINRKTINIPCCTTVASTISNMVKDEELMPPPSNATKQEYIMQCENTQPTINTTGKYFTLLYRFSYKI